MKWLTVAALYVTLAGLAAADDKKAPDVAGTWKCETDVNGQKRASTLTLKRDGDTLAGTMRWPDEMESKLTDVALKGGELTFAAVREREGQRFTIKYTVKVEGDTIKGKAAADFGGETRTFDFEGKREKAKGG
jgi:hypothetical protein